MSKKPVKRQTSASKRANRDKIMAGEPEAQRWSPKRTPEVEDVLLATLAKGWSISKAALAAGISRTTACEWRRVAKLEREALDPKDPDYQQKFLTSFFTRWEDAMESGADAFEDEAARRATGYTETVFGKDGPVGERTLYSDPLMMMIMKGKRPERYGTERRELSGPNGGAIPVSVEVEFVGTGGGKK